MPSYSGDFTMGHARLRATMSTPFGRKPAAGAGGGVEPRWVTTANTFEGYRIAEYRGVVRGINLYTIQSGRLVGRWATLPGPGVMQSETLTFLKNIDEDD